MTAAIGRVAVLMGGWSSERQVSIWSGETVLAALQSEGFDTVAVDVRTPAELFALPSLGVSHAFNVLHGTGGEDGTVQAVLDLLGIRYPGCGVLASALAMDKLQTKRLWRAEGLPTADWRCVDSAEALAAAAEAFGYPLIVKPAADGSSVGISKIRAPGEVAAAWALARGDGATGQTVLAERFVPGAEYTCAVLGDQALPLIRIEPDGEFYDYNAKYLSDNTHYHCPAGLDPALERELQALSLKAFAVLGGRGWGRVDFLMADDRRPFLLEVNTLPGMTSHSLVPLAARTAGIAIGPLCRRLLETTMTEARG
ncbi:D-alanine--D-alanine ligase [Flagellatimonas centrodinii]|uniref:D-alanine--D-alanine ligase n=1 Tax=Flagellatimonas centrodinii TaxID=2806210 RepID=UPI001FEF20E1|nr:D-alanine--D-alanine ligase [Flagellatimonas centrodinii]ULQ47099.1 D-alanine--D-alanine ligase [Flagellatimonas centrodinii]